MDPLTAAELQAILGFTEADQALLTRLHPIAKTHFGAIADEICVLLRGHEAAFAVLKDDVQAQWVHSSLEEWLDDLFCGPRDLTYFARRAETGRVYARMGLDVRYLVAAIGRIRAFVTRVSDDALARDAEASAAARLAVTRACDLDLVIMLDGYKGDFPSRVERARSQESERNRIALLDGGWRGLTGALECANVVVMCFDRSASLLAANRKAEEVTGYTLEELTAGDALEVLFGDEAPAVRGQWFAASEHGAVEMDADLRTRAGKTRTLRWYATGREADDDRPSVVIGIDLTTQREVERRARQNERLSATEALAAGLAHEIRNPLNGASLHLSVLDRSLARSLGVPPEAREATDVLRAEIKRLSALVTGFLEVARPRPLSRVVCDANDIARSVGELLGPDVEAQKKVLAIEPSTLPAMAELDVERVRQVVVNLVRNGLDAVGEGGRVVLRARRLPDHVEFDVADNGRGIPNPDAPVFDSFYTTKERGTGLGLSIVHRIVADHGGDVRFESRPGSTVFTVRIPAAVALADESNS